MKMWKVSAQMWQNWMGLSWRLMTKKRFWASQCSFGGHAELCLDKSQTLCLEADFPDR